MPVTVIQSKLLAMLAIGAGSLAVGIAPACFVSRIRELQQRLLLSCTLCFGGGVLLATSLLHVLPEVRETMPRHAELVFACGFLLLYLVDEAVHYFWGSEDEHTPEAHRHGFAEASPLTRGERCRGHSHQAGYAGATQSVRCVCPFDGKPRTSYQSSVPGVPVEFAGSYAGKPGYGSTECSLTASAPCRVEEATFLCPGPHSEPCAGTNTGLVGLLIALTVHAVLEGLAIGLQRKLAEVLLLVGAVASHKFVVGFCLGLELAGAGSGTCKLVLAISVFASGSVLGIGVGMLTLQAGKGWTEVALPILQGLAGGTLLYVTVSEVLPRERARWHRSGRRSAGILQFVFAAVGFALICLLNNYVGA